jgi:co-chaperonin GroES (HSP10)
LTGIGRSYTDKYLPVEVEVGERVVFLIGSVDTKSGQTIAKYLSEDEVLIREVDILGVIPQDSTLEVTQ